MVRSVMAFLILFEHRALDSSSDLVESLRCLGISRSRSNAVPGRFFEVCYFLKVHISSRIS